MCGVINTSVRTGEGMEKRGRKGEGERGRLGRVPVPERSRRGFAFIL